MKSFRLHSVLSKLITPVVIVLILLCLIGLAILRIPINRLESKEIEHLKKNQNSALNSSINEKFSEYTGMIDSIKERALEQAALFSNSPVVKKAYKMAYEGNINDEGDPKCAEARAYLKHELQYYVDGLVANTDNKSWRIHFHLPPARSLARLWRKGWQTKRNGKKLDVSDDISSFRSTIKKVFATGKPVTGIEVGRGGFAIRGIVPIFGDNKKVVGSCEVLFSYSPLLRLLKHEKCEELAVFMDEKLLPIATKLQNIDKYPIIANRFVYCSSTNKDLTLKNVTSEMLVQGMKKQINFKTDSYIVALSPVLDFKGESIGVLVYQRNISDFKAALVENKNMTESGISSLFNGIMYGSIIIILTGGILIFCILKKIIAPLSKVNVMAQKIRAGDLSMRLNLNLDDEMGVMGDNLDKMADSIEAKAIVAEKIANGDITDDVQCESKNDYLGHSLQKMIDNLNGMLQEIDNAVQRLSVGASEVSTSSDSVSHGAIKQAASLEEITSSVTEVDAKTKANAENAIKASELAMEASKATEDSNKSMQSMIGAMNDINESSQKIEKIIKVIDDIAFQTNLLALNAAVEAARAGKHGKGFAVVAEEVRNLASRSAKAARETAELIDESSNKVEHGSLIASETAKSLNTISEKITVTTDLVKQIAEASNVQQTNVSQITLGLTDVDDVTQQNAANAEETASASAELTSQCVELKKLISQFKLKHCSDDSESQQGYYLD